MQDSFIRDAFKIFDRYDDKFTSINKKVKVVFLSKVKSAPMSDGKAVVHRAKSYFIATTLPTDGQNNM